MKLLFSYLRRYWRLVALALVLATINQVFSLLDPLIFRHVIDQYATRFQRVHDGPVLPRGEPAARWPRWASPSSPGWPRTSRTTSSTSITQRLGAEIYSDGIRHSLELPYQVFEDQRSGETLGKLQKVRADVEKLISVSVNMLFTTLVGHRLRDGLRLQRPLADRARLLPHRPPARRARARSSAGKIKTIQKVIVAETTALAGATTESLRNIELVKSLGLAQPGGGAAQRAPRTRSCAWSCKKVRYLRSLSFIQGTLRERAAHQHPVPDALPDLRPRRSRWGSSSRSVHLLVLHLRAAAGARQRHQHLPRDRGLARATSRRSSRRPREPKPANPVPLGELVDLAFEDVGFTHQTASRARPDRRLLRGARAARRSPSSGPSGAGKTTLVKLLVGPLPPADGPHPLQRPAATTSSTSTSLRERIGFVTQDTQLFSGTIRENLLFVRPERHRRGVPRGAAARRPATACWRGPTRASTP